MLRFHSGGRRAALFASGLVCLAGGATAQGLLTSNGTIVAVNNDPVPDSSGTAIPNLTFGGSGTFDNCVLDESGNVFFRGRLVDSVTPTTGVNDRALFYGSSRSNLVMVVRAGDQAPSMAPGVLLRTATGSSSGISSSFRISPDGRLLWGSKVDDGGVTITSSNDDVMFGGPLGAQTKLVSDGDVAPGTGGALFAQAFSSPSQQTIGVNRNGHLYMQATLVNGTGTPPVTTTSGMNNQSGIWAGLPGALELVARKSDPLSGLGGEVVIDTSTSIGFVMQMNDSNKLLYDATLSQTQGTPTATVANDKVLMLYTPGLGSQLIVRESDPAPGTAGATFNSISASDTWSPSLSGNSLLRNDQVLFNTELRNGDVLPGQNDRAVYRGGVGGLSLVARRGDAAPGTDGTFDGFNNTNCLHNVAGQVALSGAITGGTVTSVDDTGIWSGMPGALELVAREGQIMPDTGGSQVGNLNGQSVYFNDQGQVLFHCSLTGGGSPGSSLWIWDSYAGLRPVVLSGDQLEYAPGMFYTVSGFGGVSFSNTDGASLHFGHDGTIGLRLLTLGGEMAIVVGRIEPGNPFEAFCFGDGLDPNVSTPCGALGTMGPCLNNGAAGNGCANSANPAGANLTASGEIDPDSVVLAGSGMPATVSCIYLQGDGLEDQPFGDGVRCAGGTLIRLRTKQNVAGASTFPDSTDTVTLSQRGMVTPGSGDVRYYQTYYRNAAAGFCPAQTFNVTNGITFPW